MTSPEDNLVQWVYSSRNEQELQERYDEWARTYEEDLDRDFGWYGPLRAVEAGIRHISKDARILDAGAGTGLVGKLLSEAGYTDLTGIDLSEGMLEQARQKNVYSELRQMVLGEPLDFPSDTFDAVFSVGVFTLGHAGADSLDEMVRVTKPGGHIAYTLRADRVDEDGFGTKHSELESAGMWKLAEVTEPTHILPKGEPDVQHQVWVFQVTG